MGTNYEQFTTIDNQYFRALIFTVRILGINSVPDVQLFLYKFNFIDTGVNIGHLSLVIKEFIY